MEIKLTKQQAVDLVQLSQNFETAKLALQEFLVDLIDDWEQEIADKSDRWQASDAGQAAQERVALVQEWLNEIPVDGDPIVDVEALT